MLLLFFATGTYTPPTPEPTPTPEVVERHTLNALTVNRKYFYYKVYTGSLLRAIWRNEVISEPNYRQVINGAEGEMVIRLARDFASYGEGKDILLNNTIKVYAVDKEAPTGRLLFNGFIFSYGPVIDGVNEYLEVVIRGQGSTLNDRILRDDSGNTTLTYNSQDPANILKDVINKFITLEAGQVGYNSSSIELTGTTVSYTFNTNTYREAIDKIVELCPKGWYWTIDSSGIIHLKAKPSTITHSFSVNKDVTYLKPERTLEDLTNEVYFVGADTGVNNLFKKKSNSQSVAAYGRKVEKIIDGRVSLTATATYIIDKVLEEKSEPQRKTVIKIIDSNGSRDKGYDLESIKVGDVVQVYQITSGGLEPTLWDNFYWDVDVWDGSLSSALTDAMQIVSLEYNPDYIVIEATSRLPEVAKRIEDINRNLESTVFQYNPSAPS